VQGRNFDQLADEWKETIINQLHVRRAYPKSEIVKRMNSFSKKSPEILKPILEG
jgi:hypothetical protein